MIGIHGAVQSWASVHRSVQTGWPRRAQKVGRIAWSSSAVQTTVCSASAKTSIGQSAARHAPSHGAAMRLVFAPPPRRHCQCHHVPDWHLGSPLVLQRVVIAPTNIVAARQEHNALRRIAVMHLVEKLACQAQTCSAMIGIHGHARL